MGRLQESSSSGFDQKNLAEISAVYNGKHHDGSYLAIYRCPKALAPLGGEGPALECVMYLSGGCPDTA